MLAYLMDAFSGPAGAFMYALLLVLALELAVVLERSLFFWKTQSDPQALLKNPAASTGSSPLEQVVAAGNSYTDPELAMEAMTAAAIDAEQQIRARVSYLATVASIATMLGLFGTVYGLILAFGALGDVAAAERAARLSEGSSTAMATTAFGLFVAIPALAAHSALEAMVRSRLSTLEATATRLYLLKKERR
jgi:biopolymer transport protein ExbB/TolQ